MDSKGPDLPVKINIGRAQAVHSCVILVYPCLKRLENVTGGAENICSAPPGHVIYLKNDLLLKQYFPCFNFHILTIEYFEEIHTFRKCCKVNGKQVAVYC
jgi:hypothetical protein